MYLSEFIWIYSSPDGNNLIVVLLATSVIKLLSLSLILLMITVIIQALLSWVNPHTPLAPVLNAITSPFIRPLQRHIPPVSGIDLSAFVLIILLQLIQMVPIYYLYKLVRELI